MGLRNASSGGRGGNIVYCEVYALLLSSTMACKVLWICDQSSTRVSSVSLMPASPASRRRLECLSLVIIMIGHDDPQRREGADRRKRGISASAFLGLSSPASCVFQAKPFERSTCLLQTLGTVEPFPGIRALLCCLLVLALRQLLRDR